MLQVQRPRKVISPDMCYVLVQNWLHIFFFTVLWLFLYGMHCLISLVSAGYVLKLWISSCWLGLLVFSRQKEAKFVVVCYLCHCLVFLVGMLAGIQTSRSRRIGLGALLLLGARHTIFLEGCLSLIYREIREHCSFEVFFCSTFCIEDLLSSMLFVVSFSSC